MNFLNRVFLSGSAGRKARAFPLGMLACPLAGAWGRHMAAALARGLAAERGR